MTIEIIEEKIREKLQHAEKRIKILKGRELQVTIGYKKALEEILEEIKKIMNSA